MLKTSEWVSLGHPDKMADFMSSYVLDRYLEKDPLTRYAVEVQIKGPWVTLGGEITSKAQFSEEDIVTFVRAAVEQIGYTTAYQKRWGKENTICADDIVVTPHITMQSPDIARGVNASGWGDQGIYWSMAVNSPETDFMPHDWWLARKIGKHLYDNRIAGLDIKTQITMEDNRIDEVVVAIPMTDRHYDYDIANAVKYCCGGKFDYRFYTKRNRTLCEAWSDCRLRYNRTETGGGLFRRKLPDWRRESMDQGRHESRPHVESAGQSKSAFLHRASSRLHGGALRHQLPNRQF